MTDDVDKAHNLLKNADSPSQAAIALALLAVVDRLDRIVAVLERADDGYEPDAPTPLRRNVDWSS